MAKLRLTASVIALSALSLGSALAQGVPTRDYKKIAEDQAIIDARNADLEIQKKKAEQEKKQNELDDALIKELDALIQAATVPPASTQEMVKDLEEGSGTPANSANNLYNPQDTNPAAASTFGDATPTVEQVIIEGAKQTYHLPGVAMAGLSLPQWRALLQALIWQESRFNITICSHKGACGLTQIMPDTAKDLGIYPEYQTNPVVQVEGGGRYLAQMLKFRNGNIVEALAAYNAGPGNVQKYGGVPPFKETQHYVVVIPQKYNEYLGKIGGIDALGTIEPILAAGANYGMTAQGTFDYAAHAAEIGAIAARIKDAILKMKANENPSQAFVLNTYVRGEMARLMALQIRVSAAKNKTVSAEALMFATEIATERAFMVFSNE